MSEQTRDEVASEILTIRTAASIKGLRAAGWKSHQGMRCWYKGPTQRFSYGLPGSIRVQMTDEENLFLTYGQITYPPGGRVPNRNQQGDK